MKARVTTAVVGLVVLFIVLFFFSTIAFDLVFTAAALLAVHEIYKAFKFGEKSLYIYLGAVPPIILIMLSGYLNLTPWLPLILYLLALFVAFVVVFNHNTIPFAKLGGMLVFNHNTIPFAKLGGMLVFSAIVVACFYSIVHFKTVFPKNEYGYTAIYYLLLALGFAWGGDTFAYFVGRAFGKKKLAPQVSPNKTVEGAWGGILGSVVVGVLLALLFTKGFGYPLPLAGLSEWLYYLGVAILAIVASLLGIMGDLFASAIKRQNKIKDYGTIFPGHGGILDRFDSLLFVAPLVAMVVHTVHFSIV